MSSETDYGQEYEQVRQAYLLGKFEEAATMIDSMAQKFPNDPNVVLLRANIYCNGLGEYELAQKQYESVLQLTDEPDLLNKANSGIQQALQLQNHSKVIEQQPNFDVQGFEHNEQMTTNSDSQGWQQQSSQSWKDGLELDSIYNFDSAHNDHETWENSTIEEQQHQTNPFSDWDATSFEGPSEDSFDSQEGDPTFEVNQSPKTDTSSPKTSAEELSGFTLDMNRNENTQEPDNTFVVVPDEQGMFSDSSNSNFERDMNGIQDNDDTYEEGEFPDEGEPTEISPRKKTPSSNKDSAFSDANNSEPQDWQKFEGIDDDSLRTDQGTSSLNSGTTFLDQFSLETISNLDGMEEVEQQQPDSDLFSSPSDNIVSNSLSSEIEQNTSSINEEGRFNKDASENFASNITSSPNTLAESEFEVKQGPLATFNNASLSKKQLWVAIIIGCTSAIAVIGTGLFAKPSNQKAPIFNVSQLITALGTGVVSGGATWLLTGITTNQVKRSITDLQKQFEALYHGNFHVQANVESQDEIGQLLLKFNQMTQVLAKTTEEAQRRAQETEQAKEDLQRQVIRLLDDVEGAARGDLTVQAEVTADVLGAVADAFNLTITNLREIVRQVKQAAQQVNRGAADSELFANNQYSSALNMAGELAVTLNSVQMLTDSIQRVAENAKEAEEVARTSSETAIKGGESVERTVAGIIEIRDKVAETARKVKRLAEASQEISKIVALISQISSRTNLLALNASIEAARAGESGRGFAIVADEVRQLADRSAKALKEIEQIVWQIQSETGSVMEAMEEGLGQVVRVTDRAEQAKRSLDDIIQVSKRIDDLVRSITASTVEQRENSRAVSEVMQSVELAAQTTSRESQRVAGSLQKLVSISQELLGSVERFRVETEQN